MAIEDDLRAAVAKRFADVWNIRKGLVVPDETSINLGNDGVSIEATILYADLADSTALVDAYKPEFAAEIYGTFLNSAARLIRGQGGTITAYDGDRVMAVFMGPDKEVQATVAGLRINKAMEEIIRPALRAQYQATTYLPHHTVGIDSSNILVVKDGIRGASDLIWVGRAANYAAKLCALPHAYATRITEPVFQKLTPNLITTNQGTPTWEKVTWTDMGNGNIYRSNCVTVGF